jgi:transposase InsO family protein
MTDACTKYVELVALPDKEALTVTSAIFSKWICRYGLPLELITDQGREFANKMSDELYSLLKLRHQTTSARHPQCNSQVERFNQTIAKYLNSFVDSTTDVLLQHQFPSIRAEHPFLPDVRNGTSAALFPRT